MRERIVSKSRLSKHTFRCGFLCVPHAYVNVNVIAFQQNEHESTPIERQRDIEKERRSEEKRRKKSLNKYIMQNERMTIPTKQQKQNEFTTSKEKNVE